MALPTVWDLFLPNANTTTLIGAILIILGIVLAVLTAIYVAPLLPTLLKPLLQIELGMVILGIFLVFAISFLEDLFASKEIVYSGIAVIFIGGVAYLLFRQPKK